MSRLLLNRRVVGVVAACVLAASMPLPSVSALPTESAAVVSAAGAREEQVEQIMQVLARPEARLHLRLLGFSPEEVKTRLARLDDAQLAMVSEQAESVRGAGDAIFVIGISLGTIVLVALVVLIIYLIVKMPKTTL